MTLHHGIDYITLTGNDLTILHRMAEYLLEYPEIDMGQKLQQGAMVQVLCHWGVVWSSKTKVIPTAVLDKVFKIILCQKQ